MYGFLPDKIPESFHKVSWEDRLERIPSDYGLPEKRNWQTPEEFRAWWFAEFKEEYDPNRLYEAESWEHLHEADIEEDTHL